ncbi:MAG: hypothetical protein JWN94_1462 [Betaproteobacteria bacterium]|nr:hypothetical protein [Betaproteobacteria bacterium]
MLNRKSKCLVISTLALAAAGLSGCADPQQNRMSFFVTSVGSGKGADLGGIAGADHHCQTLAQAAGAGNRTWRAYLSTTATTTSPGINAIDRIGRGPWMNAKGVVIATNIENLHGNNNLTKQTNLNEKGGVVNGRGDTPNTHDILTGSQTNGLAFPAGTDLTCGNYTKSGADGAVQMGHSDRQGLTDDYYAKSWNSSHASRGGCSQPALVSTGGAGLFYCFATN